METLELYQLLADRNRKRILDLVAEGERSVGELVRATRLRQPLVSHHLRVLRDAGLVGARKEGRFRLYQVASPEVGRRLADLNAKAAALQERLEPRESAAPDPAPGTRTRPRR